MGYNQGMDNHPISAATPVSDELRHWAMEQRSRNVDPEAMLQALLAVGWQTEQAQAALGAVLDTPPNSPAGARPLPGPDLSAARPALPAADRQVQVVVAMEYPPLAVFSQLLSADECTALIAAARPRLARSLTVETHTGGEQVNADRTSEGMFFERGESDLVRQIEGRIAALLRWPVDHGEGLQVLRYGPGAEYKPHYDYFDPREAGTAAMLRRGGQRLATLVMYLNTPEAGGATAFPALGLNVAPQRGNAVFFRYDRPHPNTRSLHGSAPVLAGEKWIATKWLRERTFE
ncbi:MAG: 2OG-Fe(II) oxygenase [Burkholderiales bacterium]|nr:2OG-Fe(II) oxygenase [Burkholderiales bacterium]